LLATPSADQEETNESHQVVNEEEGKKPAQVAAIIVIRIISYSTSQSARRQPERCQSQFRSRPIGSHTKKASRNTKL
jgi:hypothetical protein